MRLRRLMLGLRLDTFRSGQPILFSEREGMMNAESSRRLAKLCNSATTHCGNPLFSPGVSTYRPASGTFSLSPVILFILPVFP
jgi:hypothetical protein